MEQGLNRGQGQVVSDGRLNVVNSLPAFKPDQVGSSFSHGS